MRNTLILIGFLTFLAVLLGMNYFYQPFTPKNSIDLTQLTPTPRPSPTPSMDQEARAKIASLMMVPLVITPETKAQLPRWIVDNHPGAIVIYGKQVDLPTVDRLNEQLDQLETKTQAGKILVGAIIDGGNQQALSGEGFMVLPSWRDVCRLGLPQAETQLATVAAELNEAQINFVLSPSLDVASSSTPENLCATNAERVARFGLALMQALDKYQILPVMKHFPGTGSLRHSLAQQFSIIESTQTDLLPFKVVLERANQDLARRGVMVSLVGVKQSGSTPCALTKTCVDQVVNAYDRAIVVSDDLTQKAGRYDVDRQDYTKSLDQVAYEAIMAGNNLIYFGETASYAELDRVLEALTQRYQTDEGFQMNVETSVIMVDSWRDQYLKLYSL